MKSHAIYQLQPHYFSITNIIEMQGLQKKKKNSKVLVIHNVEKLVK